MSDYSELKRLADAAPMVMTMTNGGEEHKALIAFTDEVKRLFGNDVGMARVLIAENEALREDAERYRFIRKFQGFWMRHQHTDLDGSVDGCIAADPAIEAAMSKEG